MDNIFLREDLRKLKPYKVDGAEYRIRLDANESFIPVGKEIIQELKEQIDKALFNRYPDAESKKVCELFGNYVGVKPEKIMAGNGSDELIQIIMNTFLEKGEKVAVLNPDFSMYSFYTEISGGVPVAIELDENLKIDIDVLIEKISEIKPKIFIFSNPNNPTGGIINKLSIKKLIEKCDCLVVLDEAYMEFYEDSLIDEIEKYYNLIILKTCSKALGMASIRLGFLITNIELIEALKSVKPPFNVNSISQSFGEVVLKHTEEIKIYAKKIVEERKYLYNELQKFSKFKLYEANSNFVLLNYEKADELNNYLIEKSIKVRSFKGGRLDNFIRITAGTREENMELILAIKDFL